MTIHHLGDATGSFKRDYTAFRHSRARQLSGPRVASDERAELLLAVRRIKAALESDNAANDAYDRQEVA